uniref:Peptidase M12B domain-containing protein n=1 Tax=Anolis carolinensis TaxID=28377 RepID=A0A803TLT8_ANOCA
MYKYQNKYSFAFYKTFFLHPKGSSLKELSAVKDFEVVYPQKLHALHKRDVGGIQNSHKKTSVSLQDHCYYGGQIPNDTDSAASISACSGLRGYFKSRGKRYIIEPLKASEPDAHAVFRYESLEKEDETSKVCGVTNTTWQSDDEPMKKTSRMSTSAEVSFNLPRDRGENLVFVFFRNMTGVKTRVFEIVNYINLVYKAINIHVALIGLEIWSDGDKIAVDSSAGVTLDRFSAWRQEILLKRKHNDNAQLLTDIDFTGPTVGLAYVGTMCTPKHSLGVVQDHNTSPIAIGATMAHEMGHNFGMNHDTSFCKCSSESCIMAGQLSYKTPRDFSSCSLQDFQKYMMDRSPDCVINMPSPKEIIATPVCGNNFVEEGEECDCGSPKVSFHSCSCSKNPARWWKS